MAVNINDKVVLFRVRGKKDHIVAVPSKSAAINDKAVLLPIGSKRSAVANVPSIVNINDKVVLLKAGGHKDNIIAISDNTEGELIDACYYTTAIDMGFMEDDYHTWALLRSNKYPLESIGDGCRVIRSKAKSGYPLPSDYPTNPLSWTSEQAMLYEELGEIITEKVEGLLPNSYYGLSTWAIKNNRYSIDKTTNFFGTPRYCENVHNGFVAMWHPRRDYINFAFGFDLLSSSNYYIGSVVYAYEGKYSYKGYPEGYQALPSKPCFIGNVSLQFSNLKLGKIDSDGDFLIDSDGWPIEDLTDGHYIPITVTNAAYNSAEGNFDLKFSRTTRLAAISPPYVNYGVPLGTDCTIVVWHIYEGIMGNWVFSRNPYIEHFSVPLTLGYCSTVLSPYTEFSWIWQPAGFTYTVTPYLLVDHYYYDWNGTPYQLYGLKISATAGEGVDGVRANISFRISGNTPISFLPLRNISYSYNYDQVIVDGRETILHDVDYYPLEHDHPYYMYDYTPPETEFYIDFEYRIDEVVAGVTYNFYIYDVSMDIWSSYKDRAII